MTTNHPEKLDEALIRPGRVDHQVAFSNATESQIRELFKRMYSKDFLRTNKILISPPASAPSSLQTSSVLNPAHTPAKSNVTSQNNNAIGGVLDSVAKEEEIGEEELSSLAEEFAKEMEDDMFSPAEIQGFLLKRKKDPRRAVGEGDGGD
jgi:chaperone BCS1